MKAITTGRPRRERRLIGRPAWSRSVNSGARRAPAAQNVPGSPGGAAWPSSDPRATATAIPTPAPTTTAAATSATFGQGTRVVDGSALTYRGLSVAAVRKPWRRVPAAPPSRRPSADRERVDARLAEVSRVDEVVRPRGDEEHAVDDRVRGPTVRTCLNLAVELRRRPCRPGAARQRRRPGPSPCSAWGCSGTTKLTLLVVLDRPAVEVDVDVVERVEVVRAPAGAAPCRSRRPSCRASCSTTPPGTGLSFVFMPILRQVERGDLRRVHRQGSSSGRSWPSGRPKARVATAFALAGFAPAERVQVVRLVARHARNQDLVGALPAELAEQPHQRGAVERPVHGLAGRRAC